MAIDAEDILVCLWSFVRFFVNTSQVFALKFPFVSCVLLLFFFVYAFFNLLLYHLPFLIFVAVLLRFFWSSESQPETRNDAGQNQKDREKRETSRTRPVSRPVGDGNAGARSREISSFIRQKSRRTNFGKNRSFAAAAAAQSSEEENDTKLVVVHEESETLISFEHGQSSNADDADEGKTQPHDVTNDSPGSETSKPDSVSDDDEDEDEEEEDRAAKSDEKMKAMEWTEDDQRNVVDLGISEIERNRRLESLMAKRRARKLPKLPRHNAPPPTLDGPDAGTTTSTAMPDRRTSLMAPIFVARNALNPFEANSNANSKNDSVYGEFDRSEGPDSAPSVMLPAKNPFDIPYDPTEEKPDLMADSFQEEFAPLSQKEPVMFCRHESFFLGPYHQFGSDDRRDNAKFSSLLAAEKRGFRGQSGDNDGLIEQLFGNTNPDHIDNTPSQLVVESGSQSVAQLLDSESETSKPEGETDTTTSRDTVSEQDVLNDMDNASSLSTITEVDTEPSVIGDSETTDSSSLEVSDRAAGDKTDTSTCSVPTTTEPRAEYDSNPTASERSKSIGTEDGLFFRDKLGAHTPSCSIASDMQVEVSEFGSPATLGNASPVEGDSLSYDEELERPPLLPGDDTNQTGHEPGASSDSSSSAALANENQETTKQLAEKFASNPFFEAVYERIEHVLSPRQKSAEEHSVDEAARDSVTDGNSIEDTEEQEKNDAVEILISGEIIDNVSNTIEAGDDQEKHEAEEILISGEIMDNLTIPDEDTELGSSSTQFEHQSMEFSQPITMENFEVKIEERDTETSLSTEERRDEQSSVESEAFSADQNSVTNPEPEMQKESLPEEVPLNPSSPSSPMSTAIERTNVDEVFSSNMGEAEIQIDVPLISPDAEHMVKASLLDDEPVHDSASQVGPQNGEALVMDSSNSLAFEALQEPSDSVKISIETNVILNINEPAIEDKSGAEEIVSNIPADEEAQTPADIENALETLAEEPGNPRSEAPEEGNLQIV